MPSENGTNSPSRSSVGSGDTTTDVAYPPAPRKLTAATRRRWRRAAGPTLQDPGR